VRSRDALREFDGNNRFALFVCERAGLACVVGKRQVWRVAGRELTVELQLDRRVFYVLYLREGWPSSPDIRRRRSLCLTEAYAVTLTGEIRDFNGPELARFRTKALIEAGLVVPTSVCLPELPPGAPASAVRLWKLVEELAAVRATTGDTGPMPLVAPWLASLDGVGEASICNGKDWLERVGLIVHVDDAPGRFGKLTKLWAISSFTEMPYPLSSARVPGLDQLDGSGA
jgi:hypothetical protein